MGFVNYLSVPFLLCCTKDYLNLLDFILDKASSLRKNLNAPINGRGSCRWVLFRSFWLWSISFIAQTDYVACIAGVQAAFLANEFADQAFCAAKQNARNLTEKYKMEAK